MIDKFNRDGWGQSLKTKTVPAKTISFPIIFQKSICNPSLIETDGGRKLFLKAENF